MNNAELIVALDRSSRKEVDIILEKMPATVKWYKVGLELFAAHGPAAFTPLIKRQKKIFLDLKLHDIPNTVARAVRTGAGHGVALLTVHALGGAPMLRAAVEAAQEIGVNAPKIIAVTILTSHSQEDLAAIGIQCNLADQVLSLAELALKCGADGLVASVTEALILRERFGQDFILVVPGIRPAGSENKDQKRVSTPAAAIKAGANFLVIGRPILEASDPRAAAEAILAEMKSACQAALNTVD